MCQPAPILDSDVRRFPIGFLPTAARRKGPTPVRAVSRYSALFANDHSSADTGGRGNVPQKSRGGNDNRAIPRDRRESASVLRNEALNFSSRRKEQQHVDRNK